MDFRIAGKSKNKVDLTLSGDMLGVMELIKDVRGRLIIGINENKYPREAGKAEGNNEGTYGHSSPIMPGRKFLGISKGALKEILDKYPLDDLEKMERRSAKMEKVREMREQAEEDVEE